MAAREPLSVAVITRNESRNIERCLRSVGWAEDLVVVDSGSTDDTLEVARRCGARTFEQRWLGYSGQKNHAISLTQHAWVLSLDADEWLSEDGAAEVRELLGGPRADGYAFDRRSAFAGAFLRHVWSPDWQVRLFRKGAGRFADDLVHESVRLERGARVERLREPLLHLAYRSLDEYVDKLNRYTDLAARGLQDAGRRPSLWRLLLSPPASFFKHWVLRGGYRDGVRGLLVAGGSAFYVLVKYGKLWELERRPDPDYLRATGESDEPETRVSTAGKPSE